LLPGSIVSGQSTTVSVQVASMNLNGASVVWEVLGQQPGFGQGTNFVFVPTYNMTHWIEAEVQWPDGRRAFASNSFNVATAPNEVWIDDNLPPRATVPWVVAPQEGWYWTTTNVYHGTLAHASPNATGQHGHYFNTANSTLTVNTGDTLYTWVRIDPNHVPAEIMLQFNDENGSWEHRAFWGANNIAYGTTGTASRFSAGSIPSSGVWVKLSVAASSVGLEVHSLKGLSFDLYNGA